MNFLKNTLIALTLFSGISNASENEFNAEVVLVESLSTVWVKFENKDDFKLLSEGVPPRNKRERYLAMPIYLYGIEKMDPEDIENKEKNKAFQAFLIMKDSLKNQNSKIKCVNQDEREGIRYCTMSINGIDISKEIISSGYSAFTREGEYNKDMDEKYKEYENQAKEKNLGIWEPYYSLSF